MLANSTNKPIKSKLVNEFKDKVVELKESVRIRALFFIMYEVTHFEVPFFARLFSNFILYTNQNLHGKLSTENIGFDLG